MTHGPILPNLLVYCSHYNDTIVGGDVREHLLSILGARPKRQQKQPSTGQFFGMLRRVVPTFLIILRMSHRGSALKKCGNQVATPKTGLSAMTPGLK